MGDTEIMEPLEREIYGLRRKNKETRPFVPHAALLKVLTKDRVREVLNTVMPAHSVDEAFHRIFPRGVLVLAILFQTQKVRLVSRFIEHNQLRSVQLDCRLPFSKETLRQFMEEYSAERFYETQWEFIAPVFSPFIIPRQLDDHVTMPFEEVRKLGAGSFGQVSHVTIHPDHQSFPQGCSEVSLRDDEVQTYD